MNKALDFGLRINLMDVNSSVHEAGIPFYLVVNCFSWPVRHKGHVGAEI